MRPSPLAAVASNDYKFCRECFGSRHGYEVGCWEYLGFEEEPCLVCVNRTDGVRLRIILEYDYGVLSVSRQVSFAYI